MKIPAVVGVVCLLAVGAAAATPKFYDDDPLWTESDTQDASGVQPWEIDLFVDLSLNLFSKPGDPAIDVRAMNVNSVDEVADSNWFTNRAGRRPLSPADMLKGPDSTTGPAPGQWAVTSSKSDGVTAGFTISDPIGQRWFLKFDPPGYRGMATGTEVVVTKLVWALGYHVPENHIAALHPDRLVIAEGARFTPPGEVPRPMRPSDIDALLGRADRDPDGSYRVVASKALDGTPLGGFRFYGTRPDDPNDIVPHEHRRELRGYGTFAAWLNHVDAKAVNSLDTLVRENGRAFVRHHLIDFGSALGSASLGPREHWEGFESLVEPRTSARQIAGFGFYFPKWHTASFYDSPAIGRMPSDNKGFDPDRWKPRVPNPAFLRARADDKFWAARKLAALSDDLLRAAVQTGDFQDPEAEQFLVKALAERRDAILRAYLTAVNPIIEPAFEQGTLTLRNAAVEARVAEAPAAYVVRWSTYDNVTGQAHPLGETTTREGRASAPAALRPDEGGFIKVELSADSKAHPAWRKPVHAYFVYQQGVWRLVGFERTPDGAREEPTN